MKKVYVLLLVALCLIATSCGNKKKNAEPVSQPTEQMEQPKCHHMEMPEAKQIHDIFDSWETKTDAEKSAAIAEAKKIADDFIAKKDEMKPECDKEGKPECKHEEKPECKHEGKPEGKPELTEEQIEAMKAEMAAKKAEFDQKWADFSTLTLDEQKALIESLFQCKGHCCKGGEEKGGEFCKGGEKKGGECCKGGEKPVEKK